MTASQEQLSLFLANHYFDESSFVQSISQKNTASYFFFGDIQKNVFYISDNMRDDFGFSGNIVPDLLHVWEQRVVERSRDGYRQNLKFMFQHKTSIQDMRYKVRCANGKTIWVHAYGILKWSDDKTTPLFFSGRMTHQDDDFIVDPATSFPRETTVLQQIEGMKMRRQPVVAIGFTLNNLTEINRSKGRPYGEIWSAALRIC